MKTRFKSLLKSFRHQNLQSFTQMLFKNYLIIEKKKKSLQIMVNILLNKLQLYFYFLKNKFDDQKRKLFMTHHHHTWQFRKPILTRFANKTVSSGKRILFYFNKVYISERECCLRLSNESLIIFFYILLYFFFLLNLIILI